MTRRLTVPSLPIGSMKSVYDRGGSSVKLFQAQPDGLPNAARASLFGHGVAARVNTSSHNRGTVSPPENSLGDPARNLLETLRTPVWVYALDSLDCLWANPAALRWMGVQHLPQAQAWLQALGQPWTDWLHRCRQVLDRGQALRDRCPVGSLGHSLYAVGSPISLANGRRGLLIEGQRGEAAESHQQAILSAIPDLLIQMTREGQCLYLIQGSDIHLWRGMQPGQRASVFDLMPHSLAEQRLHYVRQALDTDTRQIYRQEIEVEGQRHHEEVRIIPMDETEVLVIVRDITSTVIAEQKLAEQADIFRRQAQRDRVLAEVTQRISQSLDLQEVLETAVTELRTMMQTNRVMVYRFEGSQGSGRVIAEAISDPAYSLRQYVVEDRCFAVHGPTLQTYRQGRIQRTVDLSAAPLSPCYVAMLQRLQVQANLVLPILQGEHLWGLLVCQQCDAPRAWTDLEVETLTQLTKQLAIALQKSELYEQLQRANQELQHLATHDKLTGLANRRYFDDYLDQEWRRLTREQAPLSLILCDIDYFKPYNDTYGHLAGDACLEQVAAAIQRAIKRPADLAARYGGEEFAIILPNTTLSGAIHTAEQVRQEIAKTQIPHGRSPSQPYITVSLGIASIGPTLGVASHCLVDWADQALYQAKEQGRDRYIVARESP